MNNIQLFFGKPVTSPCLIPVLHTSTPACINQPFMVGAESFGVTALSFGTAHGAVFVDDVDTIDVNKIGEALGNHPLFPNGASIVFVQTLDKESVKARLWQFGCGEIDATPEAICVAGTTAMMLQKVLKSDVKVSMGNNNYCVRWDRGKGVSLIEIPDFFQIQFVKTRGTAGISA